jgi:hypothetical protein
MKEQSSSVWSSQFAGETAVPSAQGRNRFSSTFLTPIATVLAVGFAFSFLPYFVWWHRIGHFEYIADKDNQYYLQLASRLYYGNPFSMRDVVVPGANTMYQSFQFVPVVLLVRMLSLPVLEVNLVWHLWAAIALPLAFYFVFFHWLQRPWAAACCAIIMLVDCGVSTTEPFVIQAVRVFQTVTGRLPVMYDGQDLLGQWRIIDPAVGMPFLLLQVLLVSAAVERPQSGSVSLGAGISTALLFYVWFYYWSAAVAALAIGFVLDRSARRTYAVILGIGLAVGAPAMIEGLITKPLLDPQALHRIGVFAPVSRLAFFLLPKAGLLALLVTGVWIWRKPSRDGLYLWCLALAALALSNNHIITGLDLRAGHWRFIWGMGLSILVLVMVTQVLHNNARLSRVAMIIVTAAIVLTEVSTGAVLRIIEVEHGINARVVADAYRTFVAQPRLNAPGLFPVGAVVAGDEELCDLASIVSGTRPLAGYAAFVSLGLSDQEWETREALNAHLEGLSELDFRKQAFHLASGYGWGESVNPQKSLSVEAGMMREFRKIESPSELDAAASGVRYVALQAARPDPEYLKHGWSLVEAGPYWRVWSRSEAVFKPATNAGTHANSQ